MLLSMIEAAKEEIPSSFLAWCADPASAARMVNLEKSHQGIAPEKSALLLGQPVCNSTTALGLRGLAALDRVRSRCTGKERDSESGLDMFGARYYGSSLGRFMTPDWEAKPTDVPYASFGNPQSLNLYSYVNNNPTTTRDPDGHCPPCGEDLIEDLALEHPEAAEAVVNAVEEVVGEGTAVAGSEGPAVAGSARWGLLAGPALFIGEMINPHTTVGGDKPPAAVPSPQMEEHTKGARPSTADDHQKGTTRKDRDARGGEKGDKAREDKGM